MSDFQAFLSYKSRDDHGCRTRDSEIAESVYSFFADKGLNVFFSDILLERIGKSCYSSVIDEALDSFQVLVVVGTSANNSNSIAA